MLHSITKENQKNKNGLNELSIKMKQSLDNLESIQSLLKNKNSIHQVQKKKQDKEVDDKPPIHTERINELEKQCNDLRSEIDKKNETMAEKEQLLQQVEQKVEKLQLSLTTLSTRHNTYVNEWQDKYNNIIIENGQYTLQIKGLNHTMKEMKNSHHLEIKERDEIQATLKNKIQEQETLLTEKEQETTNNHIIELIKADLLLYQEKLSEKMSQNKELESTIERMTRHNEILKNSLNESRKESIERYNKMIFYMNKK